MLFLKKLNEIFFKYINIFQIANIKRNNYFFVLFLTLITICLDALGIGILLPIAEYILNYENGGIPDTYSWKIITKVFTYINLKPNISLVLISVIFIMIIRQVIVYFRIILIDIIRFKAMKDFREKLFKKFLRQDIYYIKNQSTGMYNNIINLEVDNVGKAIVLPLDNISGIILIISYLFLMMLVSVKATLVVILCIIFIGSMLKSFLKYIESLATTIINVNNRFSQNLVDRLVAVKLIRVNNMIRKEELLNKIILKDQLKNNIKLSKIQKLLDSSIEPLLLMIAIPIIFISITLKFPLAKLGVFIILLARFIPVFKSTLRGIQSHSALFASVESMLKTINIIDKQREYRKGNDKFSKKIKKIVFNNIYFKYKDSKISTIKNFSCIIKGGVINALIGASGSGKTTLMNMIPRLIEPKKGKITVNEKNLSDISVDIVRNMCAYIEQKPSFLRGTVIDHITYNNTKVNFAKVIQASKLAKSHEFIISLQNGYNYELGERGQGLSGGQLQRLDITRAIASNKPLMILDEPTSNLDENNTKDILNTLKKINKVKNTTIIIVTHDKNVLKYCDNIIKI